MRSDILPALLKLISDVEKPDADEKSRRIYNDLEEWMKEILKNTICTKDLEIRRRHSLDYIGSEVEEKPQE
jgi:hypothetical protein